MSQAQPHVTGHARRPSQACPEPDMPLRLAPSPAGGAGWLGRASGRPRRGFSASEMASSSSPVACGGGGGVIRNAASPVGEHGLSRSSGRARLAEPRPSHGMAQVKTPTTPARAHRAGPALTRTSRPMGSGALASQGPTASAARPRRS